MAAKKKPRQVPTGQTGKGGNKGTDLGAKPQTFQVGNTQVSRPTFDVVAKQQVNDPELTPEQQTELSKVRKETALRETALVARRQQAQGGGLPSGPSLTPEQLQEQGRQIQQVTQNPLTLEFPDAQTDDRTRFQKSADRIIDASQLNAQSDEARFMGVGATDLKVAGLFAGEVVRTATKGLLDLKASIGFGDAAEVKDYREQIVSVNKAYPTILAGVQAGTIDPNIALMDLRTAMEANNGLRARAHLKGLDSLTYWKDDGYQLEVEANANDQIFQARFLEIQNAARQAQLNQVLSSGGGVNNGNQ